MAHQQAVNTTLHRADGLEVITPMKLELRVAAGRGSPLLLHRYELDIDSQPEEIQQQLHLLIRQVQEIPSASSNANLRDAISYELTIFSEEDEYVIEGQSGSLPVAMQLLIAFVKRLTPK